MITLDWDKTSEKIAIVRCKNILKWETNVTSIILKISPTGKGYHVYIFTYEELDPIDKLEFRKNWVDDPKRIKLDTELRKESWSVLFSMKVINGVKHYEKPFLVFTR